MEKSFKLNDLKPKINESLNSSGVHHSKFKTKQANEIKYIYNT